MKTAAELEEALTWARNTRQEAIRQKRASADYPPSPLAARLSQEELEKAEDAVIALTTILDELEAPCAQVQEEPAPQKPVPFRTLAAGAVLSFGLASLATLGFAAACVVIRAPDPAVQATAVVGVALSLAWAVKTAGK